MMALFGVIVVWPQCFLCSLCFTLTFSKLYLRIYGDCFANVIIHFVITQSSFTVLPKQFISQ